MAEPQDAVMPVLPKIHKDIADFRKASEAKANDIAEAVAGQGEKLDEIEERLTYHLGVTAQHVPDIKGVLNDVKDLKARVAELEGRS